MEIIGDKINEKIKSLIDEAKQLIEGAEENKKDLEKKQKDLKNKLILKKLLGILKITSHAMGYVTGTPIGMVGEAIEKGANIVTSLIPEDKNYESKFEISSDIRSSLNQLDKISKDDQAKIVEQKLQKLNEICSKNPKLSDILSEIKKAAVNKNSEEILKLVQTKLKLKQEKLEEKLKKPKNNDLITNQDTKEMLEIVQNLNHEIQLAEMTFEFYNKYQKDKEKLDILNNAVKQAEDDIKKLKSYEENIYSQIIPMIEKMQSDMNNLGNQIDKKSHVFLDLSKWQVRSSLNEVKIILRQISKGFPEIRDYLTSYMDKLNEGMTTIINIYDRIQSYYDQSRLANYIANISSPTNTTEIENEKLKKEIEKLEREIRFNIILGYYKKAISAFKQWVFPFAHLYSNANLLSLSLNNSDEVINSIIQQIADLKLDIKKDKATINKKDGILMDGEFNGEDDSSRSFFVWENKKYHEEISELLNGEEITIKADIEESDRNKSAIKFNKIKIRFKLTDEELQNEIDSIVKSFDVTMTHLGNSYYRFGDEFHVIRSNQPVIIRYSFKTNNEGPIRTNSTYTKVHKGSIMLSPYTMWKLKLNLNPNEKDNFSKLRTYEDKVNLELVGHGTYVDSDNIVSQGEILTGY